MRYVTPIDSFFNKFKRPGFLLYVGLVLGALGWTFWEMHLITRKLEAEEKQKKEKKSKNDAKEQR